VQKRLVRDDAIRAAPAATVFARGLSYD
jgi:hypothetical protein